MRKGVIFVSVVAVFLGMTLSAAYAWPFGKKAAAPAKQAEPAAAQMPQAPAQAPAPAPETQAATGSQAAALAVEEAAPAPAPAPAAKAESEETRLLREKKKKQLNDTVWEIDVVPLSGKGEKGKDTLIFTNNKFSSEAFVKLGFQPSNFTLSLQEQDLAVAETMQSSDKEGIIFWRVEFDATLATCKGIYSRQFNNKADDYSFVSTAKRPYVASAPPAVEPTKAPENAKP